MLLPFSQTVHLQILLRNTKEQVLNSLTASSGRSTAPRVGPLLRQEPPHREIHPARHPQTKRCRRVGKPDLLSVSPTTNTVACQRSRNSMPNSLANLRRQNVADAPMVERLNDRRSRVDRVLSERKAPYNGRAYDSCCNLAGMFVLSEKSSKSMANAASSLRILVEKLFPSMLPRVSSFVAGEN